MGCEYCLTLGFFARTRGASKQRTSENGSRWRPWSWSRQRCLSRPCPSCRQSQGQALIQAQAHEEIGIYVKSNAELIAANSLPANRKKSLQRRCLGSLLLLIGSLGRLLVVRELGRLEHLSDFILGLGLGINNSVAGKLAHLVVANTCNATSATAIVTILTK